MGKWEAKYLAKHGEKMWRAIRNAFGHSRQIEEIYHDEYRRLARAAKFTNKKPAPTPATRAPVPPPTKQPPPMVQGSFDFDKRSEAYKAGFNGVMEEYLRHLARQK